MSTARLRDCTVIALLAFLGTDPSSAQDRKREPGIVGVDEGGQEGTEEAVHPAHEWLRRHQSPGGAWRARGFPERCEKAQGGPCRIHGSDAAGAGHPDFDVGVTALAVIAFSGLGETHREAQYDEYRVVVERAVNFLLGEQIDAVDPRRDGRIGKKESWAWVYNHTLATLALCELLVMTDDDALRGPVASAVKLTLRTQNGDGGWRYGTEGPSDTSVTTWSVLALKAAKNAGIRIPKEAFTRAFARTLSYLDSVTDEDGRVHYQANLAGDNRSVGHPTPYPFSTDRSTMTAAGLLARFFCGVSREDPVNRKAVQFLMKAPPKWAGGDGKPSTINFYYWYFGTYAMFQVGGKEWRTWHERMQKALLAHQRVEDRGTSRCVDGSWDPVGEWGNHGGRVYATALGAMTLEVYYRFRRIQEDAGF